jgi:AAA domain
MELRTSERKRAKMKMGLQGPSGSGKTYSSLLLASGLTDDLKNVAVIDTENGSADLYAHLGAYNVLRLTRPYTPERYITAIETCETAGMEVIILDSITMEWETLLEIHGNMPGNSFANWSKITPRHNAFIHKMLQSPCHVIATIRSKQDYVLSEKNGKYVPEKVGLKGVTRDGMDYEFTMMFDIDIKHHSTASKDRTGLFMDQPSFVITQGTGRRILKWCNNGVELEKIKQDIKEAQTVETLRGILTKHPVYRKEIEPLCMAKKEAIERVESINVTNGL